MKKWFNWKSLLIVLASLIILIASYTIYLYFEIRTTFEVIHEPLEITTKTSSESPNSDSSKNNDSNTSHPNTSEDENSDSPKPITVLLLGLDTWETSGRADTILVLTLNPEDESMKILSIPRDTYTEIVGFDFEDKINHSYAFGGIETSIASVENLLQIPIDYYVTLNMLGFIEMVDIVGGVEVENDIAFSKESFYFPEGHLTLTGDEALSYVRMRYDDPRGDWGRQMRQRQVLESIFKKAASFNLVWQAPSFLKSIREHVQTNLTFDEMIEFQSSYKSTLNNIDHFNFSQGDGKITNGIWYYFLNEIELQEMRKMLQESLL
ncbi:LCP family protein [Ureibacillus sp. MALMAid1270]|uniref:LCP family glycopolymer transferase n=1 Tax=Ureibacillus sp. MALMAid1270 TaxID=3411629 RepID=UPI003BA64D69